MKITFPLALFLLFLGLKLAGIITWSWWWVTAPLWIGLAVGLGIIAVIFVGSFVLLGATAAFDRMVGR